MIKIVSLVENTTQCACNTAHGLSLYIETPQHKILFDVGGDDTFIKNAQLLGVDLTSVDTVIISHGHRDHGGALAQLLAINSIAKVYIQRRAFLPHFSYRATGIRDIGLDTSLMTNNRVILLDSDFEIDSELILFKVTENTLCRSSANATLYEESTPDNFEHEQNLIIRGDEPILIIGCGHNGVVNIMNRAKEYSPKICIGGFHLTNPSARRDEPQELIDQIIDKLKEFAGVEFYTCHCTGENVFRYMKSKMDNIHYLSCGQSIVSGATARIETLVERVTTSWDGTTLPSYPSGQPTFTMLRVTIPPKCKMEPHSHQTMNLGYILKGELTINNENGNTTTIKAGDTAVEMVGKIHYGENRGDCDCVFFVVCIL